MLPLLEIPQEHQATQMQHIYVEPRSALYCPPDCQFSLCDLVSWFHGVCVIVVFMTPPAPIILPSPFLKESLGYLFLMFV